MSRYEIIVESIGKVHEGESEAEARSAFGIYAHRSKFRMGRCAGMSVSLWKDNEPLEEYDPDAQTPTVRP